MTCAQNSNQFYCKTGGGFYHMKNPITRVPFFPESSTMFRLGTQKFRGAQSNCKTTSTRRPSYFVNAVDNSFNNFYNYYGNNQNMTLDDPNNPLSYYLTTYLDATKNCKQY